MLKGSKRLAPSEPNQPDANETPVRVTLNTITFCRFGASAQFEFDSTLFLYFSFNFFFSHFVFHSLEFCC